MFPGHGIERPYYGPEQPSRSHGPEHSRHWESILDSPGHVLDSPGHVLRPGRPQEVPGVPREVPEPGGPQEIPRPTPESEPAWTGRIEIDVANPAKPGIVDVHKIELGKKVSPVVIDRAHAVQIGRHEHQVNKYRYQMDRPIASIDSLLDGHPAVRRALEGLVADPDSKLANYSFRQLLPVKSPIACGRPVFTETSGLRITWNGARVDEQGRFVVKRSQGVQIGARDVQHNKFKFQAKKSELSLAHVLRDRPDLTAMLAMALRDPANQSVRHSLENKLAGAYTRLGGLVSELRGQFHDKAGLSVSRGYAVQLGEHNSRVDKVILDVRKVVLTGWGSAGSLALEQPGTGPEPGFLRNEQAHRQRAGLAARGAIAGHPGLTTGDALNMIVPPALHAMAAAAVSTFAPGRQHLVPGVSAELSTALETICPFEGRADLALKVPVLLQDGVFSLGTRPAESDARTPDETLPVNFSVELNRPGWADTDAAADRAVVLLLDAQAGPTSVHEGYQAAQVIGSSEVIQCWQGSRLAPAWPDQQPALSTAGPQALGGGPNQAHSGSAGSNDGSRPRVAVVILGSALLIAAGRRVLDADTLVCFARQAILREIYDGSPASAVLAMRLARALEIVVLLDLALNGGIWIDVNPGTEEAEATLLIDGLPGDPRGTMRFIHA
jgi:hypothetical protein